MGTKKIRRNWGFSKETRNKAVVSKNGQLKKGFQPRTSMCKNKKGELLGGEEEIRKRWMEHFKELLNTESNGKGQVDKNIEASAQEQCIEEPNTQEVREVIKEGTRWG